MLVVILPTTEVSDMPVKVILSDCTGVSVPKEVIKLIPVNVTDTEDTLEVVNVPKVELRDIPDNDKLITSDGVI